MRAGESKLNDLESEIMRYIIELRDDIDDVTLKSVAERFFVAPNTIVRLALIINFIRTPPTFIRTCADECGNPIP